jgi:hypothetical protein
MVGSELDRALGFLEGAERLFLGVLRRVSLLVAQGFDISADATNPVVREPHQSSGIRCSRQSTEWLDAIRWRARIRMRGLARGAQQILGREFCAVVRSGWGYQSEQIDLDDFVCDATFVPFGSVHTGIAYHVVLQRGRRNLDRRAVSKSNSSC